ncbi:hypothetical protein FACS189421_12180 [Bacteroidia bacterium]|nr:hypothetical protein FACS189421_12180 [Bacteroidia bacterium]GHT03658.1 hypothetical protein FACS189423_05070 [Bacteroidia bacterium]
MQSSTRVIVNTGIQYVKTFISVCIALYSSRIILHALGESDYGIYSLVGGIISMLSFINLSLASTTQRFLSFYQGKKEPEIQIKIFNNSIFIQLFLGLVLALAMYFLTPLIFGGFLNIPPEKTATAIIVYYSMIVSVFFSILSTPYVAALIAHENILFTSIVQIAESVFKLGIAISLYYIFYDKLIYYAILITGIAGINFLVYSVYCSKKYDECKHISFKKFDYRMLKEIFSFSGWTLYSTGCIVSRTQGIAVILNKFFGTTINAAYGISQQLAGQINFISGSLLNAIRPQMIKSEGELNRKKMLRLSEIASKFAFLLLAMIVIPTVYEMDSILSIWLEEVPEYAVVFARFVLLTALVDQLTVGLGIANQAIGNIKQYSLVINTIKVLTLPAAYICLRTGLPPVSVMVCMLSLEFICSFSRLFFLKKTAGLFIRQFMRRVCMLEIIPFVCTVFVCGISHFFLPHSLFWLSFLLSMGVLSSTAYLTGLCEDEKEIINDLFLKFTGKIRHYYWLKRPKKLSENIFTDVFGRKINWKNPKDLNEKIHWLKLYSDTSRWSDLADKYKVREYVTNCGLGHLLNELYAQYDSPDEIDISKLPDSFVMKTNNGCGDAFIIKDKSTIKNEEVQEYFKEKLAESYGVFTAEPHYLKINPCVIAEKLLENTSPVSSSLIDYKFLCFAGKVKYILVCTNREGGHCDLFSYDTGWQFRNDCLPLLPGRIPKPQSLSVMIEACQILSKGFPFVRIDFYEINGRPVFGEMTFTPGAGFIDYYTPAFLEELGSYIHEI